MRIQSFSLVTMFFASSAMVEAWTWDSLHQSVPS